MRGERQSVGLEDQVVGDLGAASRYFFTRAGDIASDSAELSKPASLAGSTGNSRVGRRSTPVRSRIVLSYSALLSRRDGTCPGSPAFRDASSRRTAPIQSMIPWRDSVEGFFFAFAGGIVPASSCSSTRSHRARSFATESTVVNALRSSSPLGSSLP